MILVSNLLLSDYMAVLHLRIQKLRFNHLSTFWKISVPVVASVRRFNLFLFLNFRYFFNHPDINYILSKSSRYGNKDKKKYLYLYNRYVHIYLQAMHIAQTKRIMKKSAFVDFFSPCYFFLGLLQFLCNCKERAKQKHGAVKLLLKLKLHFRSTVVSSMGMAFDSLKSVFSTFLHAAALT